MQNNLVELQQDNHVELRNPTRMLRVINLFVIDQIFSNCEVRLTPQQQMIYINCLIHHFRDKKPIESSAVQFEIFKNDFPKFETFRKNLEQLHQAKLIRIDEDRITFLNMWGQYIDRTLLVAVPEDYEGEGHFHSVTKFENELRTNSKMQEHLKMRYKVDDKKYQETVSAFVSEQSAVVKKYSTLSDCLKHFSSWTKYNVTAPAIQQVKSNSKRLGD